MTVFNLTELAELTLLCVRGQHLTDAQKYLEELLARIEAIKTTQLPMVATTEPKLEVAQNTASQPVPGLPPRDAQGNVTRISTQIGDPGYDPEIHLNQDLKIFCDGVHIPTAHTADTVEGLVKYYKKNDKGRIKTLETRGKVDILGL